MSKWKSQRKVDQWMWMTLCTGSARGEILGDLKKSEFRTRLWTWRVDFRGSLRPVEFARHGRSTKLGADGKAKIERIVIFWPSARAKCHSRWCTGSKWHIPMAVMWGNRVCGNWLMKWDELKNSHGTLIDWCTGREWPLNYMTVISAWWRLNIRFQRSSGRRTII